MTETIHQIAKAGIDIFVIILLGMASLFILLYVGWFLFQFLFMLFKEFKRK